MLSIDIVIPVINQHAITERVAKQWLKYASSGYAGKIVLIDNNSDPPLQDMWDSDLAPISFALSVQIMRNEQNLGLIESLVQALEYSSSDLLIFTHNDLLIWRQDWDLTVESFFLSHPNLGLAGAVGGVGLADDGGRLGTYSRFLGREWGGCECHEVVWQHHGSWTPDEGIPVAVLDGAMMIFRRSALDKVGIDRSYPLHHWYDRDISLSFLSAGYHVMVIPLEVDHYSGLTANASPVYHDAAREWLISHGESIPNGNADLGTYLVGERIWRRKWKDRLPVIVDRSFSVRWQWAG